MARSLFTTRSGRLLMPNEMHKQVGVKVNTKVDEKMADLIVALNSVEGLETISSCQGQPGVFNAYVYFCFGDWETISKFAFQEIAPALQNIDGASISVKMFSDSEPMGELSIRDTLPDVTRAIVSMLNRRRSGFSDDKAHRAPCSY